MKKGIELPKETIDALLNGASIFIMPIKKTCNTCKFNIEDSNYFDYWHDCRNEKSEYSYEAIANVPNKKCGEYKPAQWFISRKLQVGDEFYVQEEFVYHFDPMFQAYRDMHYKNEEPDIVSDWSKASQMTYELSRIKGTTIDVQLKRVQDINVNKDFTAKDKKYFESFTYHCTTEPINFKRHRGFKEYLKRIAVNYDDNLYVFLVKVDLL